MIPDVMAKMESMFKYSNFNKPKKGWPKPTHHFVITKLKLIYEKIGNPYRHTGVA